MYTLIQPPDLTQVHVSKDRLVKLGPGEVGPGEVDPAEVGLAEVGPGEVGPGEVRVP